MREHMPKREIWFVEYDGNLLMPRLVIKRKKDIKVLQRECEQIEAKMFLEELKRATAKAYSNEVLLVAH